MDLLIVVMMWSSLFLFIIMISFFGRSTFLHFMQDLWCQLKNNKPLFKGCLSGFSCLPLQYRLFWRWHFVYSMQRLQCHGHEDEFLCWRIDIRHSNLFVQCWLLWIGSFLLALRCRLLFYSRYDLSYIISKILIPICSSCHWGMFESLKKSFSWNELRFWVSKIIFLLRSLSKQIRRTLCNVITPFVFYTVMAWYCHVFCE